MLYVGDYELMAVKMIEQKKYENTGAIHTDPENDRFLPKHKITNIKNVRSRMFDIILNDIEKNR